MKIAILSDIHGNFQALKAIINDIKENNIDKTIFLGDAIAIGPNPKECLDLIIDNNISMVLGNHELYYIKGINIDDEMSENEIKHQHWVASCLNDNHKSFLTTCPLEIIETIGNTKLSFKHFLLNEDKNDLYPFDSLEILNDGVINKKFIKEDIDISFIGHEHIPFEIEENNKKLIDVGSSGCTKDNTTFYTILSVNDDSITIEKKYLTYDRKSFEETIKNTIYPDREIISKIFFGIDLTNI